MIFFHSANKNYGVLAGDGIDNSYNNDLAEIEGALSHHELIKVKVPTDDREEKALIMDAIIRETNAEKLQTIGHTLVLFRQSDEKKIELPRK